MSLPDAVNYALEKLTHKQLAGLLNVTPAQVYKYAVGETKSPRDEIIDAFYDNIAIGGEPILLDFFADENEYLQFRKIRQKSNVNVSKTH